MHHAWPTYVLTPALIFVLYPHVTNSLQLESLKVGRNNRTPLIIGRLYNNDYAAFKKYLIALQCRSIQQTFAQQLAN